MLSVMKRLFKHFSFVHRGKNSQNGLNSHNGDIQLVKDVDWVQVMPWYQSSWVTWGKLPCGDLDSSVYTENVPEDYP